MISFCDKCPRGRDPKTCPAICKEFINSLDAPLVSVLPPLEKFKFNKMSKTIKRESYKFA